MSIAEAPELLYAEDEDELDDFPLREGLNWRQRKEANQLRTLSRGVMLVTGDPGGGKDLFGVSLCARHKYLFNRRILLDFPPKRAFGKYTPFGMHAVLREIDKMAKLAGVEGIEGSKDSEEVGQFVEQATTRWALEGEGEVLLKNAIWYLQELKRCCYNREPGRRVNKFVGAINAIWRHLDLLVIGSHVLEHEIDKYTYLSYAKLRAHCTWCISRPYTTEVRIRRGAFATGENVFVVEGKPLTIYVDGNEPREWLGGKRFFDLWKSKNYVNLKPTLSKEVAV